VRSIHASWCCGSGSTATTASREKQRTLPSGAWAQGHYAITQASDGAASAPASDRAAINQAQRGHLGELRLTPVQQASSDAAGIYTESPEGVRSTHQHRTQHTFDAGLYERPLHPQSSAPRFSVLHFRILDAMPCRGAPWAICLLQPQQAGLHAHPALALARSSQHASGLARGLLPLTLHPPVCDAGTELSSRDVQPSRKALPCMIWGAAVSPSCLAKLRGRAPRGLAAGHLW
jgi:hypothetical protein